MCNKHYIIIMRVQYCCKISWTASPSASSFYNYSKWLGNMKRTRFGQCWHGIKWKLHIKWHIQLIATYRRHVPIINVLLVFLILVAPPSFNPIIQSTDAVLAVYVCSESFCFVMQFVMSLISLFFSYSIHSVWLSTK